MIHILERSAEPDRTFWNFPILPDRIFVEGNLEALDLLARIPSDALSIVGTRSPQPRSIGFVRRQILKLSHSSLIIISGLARGIDAAAHEAALEAGIPTIAIVGGGLDLVYPRENADLRKRILSAGGLIVSEYPPGTPACAHHFLMRNRIIAAWGKATWVVEAPFRSGALNTARWARDLHRFLFATSCYPGDPALSGNQVLIDRDHALPFWDIHSLGAAWLELVTPPPSKKNKQKFLLDSLELRLQQHVKARTYESGGTSIHEALSWALSENWEAHQFFDTLTHALKKEFFFERQGVLFALP